jgi:hypothetical protein
VFDIWQWNNCINVYPLEHKGSYFLNGAKGAKKLVPGCSDMMPNLDVGNDAEAEED